MCFFESTSLVEGLLDLLLFLGGGDNDADDDELIMKLLTRLTLAYLLINWILLKYVISSFYATYEKKNWLQLL